MWTKAEELRFSVMMGLRKGLKLIRGMRRELNEDQQRVVAEAIVKDLEQNNWKFQHGPEKPGHGPALMKGNVRD